MFPKEEICSLDCHFLTSNVDLLEAFVLLWLFAVAEDAPPIRQVQTGNDEPEADSGDVHRRRVSAVEIQCQHEVGHDVEDQRHQPGEPKLQTGPELQGEHPANGLALHEGIHQQDEGHHGGQVGEQDQHVLR